MTAFPCGSLDLTHLTEVAGGDPEVIAAVLALYLEVAGESLASLRAALTHDDRATLAALAHRLRGASSSAGAAPMAELAASLEGEARTADAGALEALVADLSVALGCVRVAAAPLLLAAAMTQRHPHDAVASASSCR